MSGLFGDILCLRFFLSGAYFWLFVNAVTGFPNWNELFHKEVFILHIDVLLWTTVTLYTHATKFIGIVLNERKVDLPIESMPLYRMMYRNGGLSELLFRQFVWPRFGLTHLKKGDKIEDDGESLYIILEGTASANITLKGRTKEIALGSGEVIHVKGLNIFKQAQCEAFAEQTVHAVVSSESMRVYRCSREDMDAIARQPQTKQAYQGLLIFVLTRISERAILQNVDIPSNPSTGLHPAFLPLEDWEEPDPMNSGSGKALDFPIQHFVTSLRRSYRPPYPMIKWIPGLRHSTLPAPHHCPSAPPNVSDTLRQKLRKSYHESSSTSPSSLDEESALSNEEQRPLLT